MAVSVLVLLMMIMTASLSTADNKCTTISDLNSNCTEVVFTENQELAAPIEVINIDSIVTIGALSEPINVTCTNGGRLIFRNISHVVINNIRFYSCGDERYSKYGLEFSNVKDVYLSDIVVANSSFGALHILNGRVNISNIVINDNSINNGSNVVSLIDSPLIRFSGTNKVSNNWLEKYYKTCSPEAVVHFNDIETAVLFISNSMVEIIGSLSVNDNFGPSGIVHIRKSIIEFQGEGTFTNNKVCVHGALYLESTNSSLTETFLFENNTAHEYYFQNRPASAASIGLSESHLNIRGLINFKHNHGDVTAMYIYMKSSVSIFGTVRLTDQTDGYTGIFVRRNLEFVLEGTGEFLRNRVHSSVIRLESGKLRTNGSVLFHSNHGSSPCTFRIRSTVLMTGSVTFRNNSGVFYVVDSRVVVDGEALFDGNNVRDFGLGGAVALFRSELDLRGQYTFKNNAVSDVDGGVVSGQRSSIIFQGNGTFVGNSARYGGVIYFQNKPTIKLRDKTTLYFSSNTAIKGGVFYIFGSLDSFQCSNETALSDNFEFDTPSCFITADGTISDHSLIFHNNTAKQGGSVLQVRVVEDFDLAEMRQSEFSKCENCAVNLFTRGILTPTNSKPAISSDTFQLCFCSNGEPNCSQNSLSVEVVRGDFFTAEVIIMAFNLFQLDQLHPVRSYFHSSNYSEHSRRLITGDLHILGEQCSILNFAVQSTSDKELIMISADESCEVTNAQLTMKVSLEACPYGFSSHDGMCECDDNTKRFFSECDVTNQTLTKNKGFNKVWMKAHIENNVYIGLLYYEFCPFEYCDTDNIVVHNVSESDNQCAPNRAGIVCGKCQEGFSRILGKPLCRKCTNSYLALLILFALLGILLVVFLFVSQLTVATGTIHGLILYANIVNANRDTLFSTNFCPAYVVFISWLNLDFGIVTCFYDGMDQLSYTGWQFVFPLYLWFVVGCMIAACHYSVRVSKLFGKTDPVAVLATIILLSYNKLLQNVVAIFSAANLRFPPNSTEGATTVWNLDANIEYGVHGYHIVLCGVALLILAGLFLPYTLILTSSPILQKSSVVSSCLHRLRLTPFIKTYHAPYKSHARFWIGLCLLLRCAILSTIAGTDNATYGLVATAVICILLISIMAVFRGVYSKQRIDILETSFIMNLGILSIFTYHFQSTGRESTAFTYVSVTVAIVTFCGIIIARIMKRIQKLAVFKRAAEKMSSKMSSRSPKKEQSPQIEGSECSIATNQDLVMMEDNSFQLELREPLLEESGATVRSM